jgi:hypothetical protein
MENNDIEAMAIDDVIGTDINVKETTAKEVIEEMSHENEYKHDLVLFLRSVGIEADESESFDDLDKKRLNFIKELDKKYDKKDGE